MKVSVVIVTYNRLTLLKECLSRILNQNYNVNSIFIINNKSTDGTKEFLNSINNDKVMPINSHKNLGGAGGFNLGTKIAYEESDSDYLWLMDDDTMPTKDSLNRLIKAGNNLNNNFGFLCSNVRWWKDHHSVNVPEVSTNDWPKFLPKNNIIKVKNATFVSFLIKREVITKLGLPISEMFVWGDDYEYSTRISQHFDSYFVSDSIIIHKSANSNGNETIYNTNRIVNYNYMYRNYLFVAKKYYGFKSVIKKILSYMFIFLKALFISKNMRIKRSLCALKGIVKGLIFSPKIKYPNKIIRRKDNYNDV